MSRRLQHVAGFGSGQAMVNPSKAARRGPVTHVIILDGTMSSLEEGYETNAGITYRLLSEMAPNKAVSLKYEAGIQWQGVRRAIDVVAGIGINRQIRRAYGFLASRYRPGDKIFLFGFSRGAYAVRSLAGVIDRVGLLHSDCATERNVRQAYRHYRTDPDSLVAQSFRATHCHESAEVEMVGVWDTVRALGLRAPMIWRFSPVEHEFHHHHLGNTIRHGFHALALNETRKAFEPVLWDSTPGYTGTIKQVWFAGSHGDVGGHLTGFEPARPLSNIALVWMLEHAEMCGLPLPPNWKERYPRNVDAPSVGTFRGWSKLFLSRRSRRLGHDPSEAVHASVHARAQGWARRLPWVKRPDLRQVGRP